MSRVSPTTDNVETVHEQAIAMTGRYVAALGRQWYDLSREDRVEATKVIHSMMVSLRTLGIRL